MPKTATVDEAVSWSRELTRMRTRGPGDLENAMRSIERDYGVDYWTLWQLRYRAQAVKDVGATVYLRLQAAYRAECDRQKWRYENARSKTETTTGLGSALVSAADALAGSEDGVDE